jgi:hypothetical protein
MAKDVKNLPRLSELETHFVDVYIMNWSLIAYILKTKYAGPKDLAEKILIKTTRSKVKTAEALLFLRGFREPTGIYTPSKLNEILKRELGIFHNDSSDTEPYLRPSIITQVLKKLERDEVYYNVRGKKGLKNKGLKLEKSSLDFKRLGGRPSSYMISDIYSKSNEFLSNPRVRNLIHKKLIDHKIGLFVWKFITMAVFYSFKIDKEAASKIPLMVGPTHANVDLSNIRSKFDELATLDENKLEELAEQNAKFMLSNHIDLSATGLFGLILFSIPK